MNILALEPYYGGSHQGLLDGLITRSRHHWTLLTLPPHKWKWRMRHAAVTFAEMAGAPQAAGQQWDVLFASDMLNLAEFLYDGSAGQLAARLQAIAAGVDPGQWTVERVGYVCEPFDWNRRAEEMDRRFEERGR
jgi:hypothetical protein